MNPWTVTLSEAVQAHVRVAVIQWRGLVVRNDNPHWSEMEALGEGLRHDLEGLAPAQIPGLQPARRLYKAVGVDPTRIRPSSEALLRRVLQGKPLYQINTLVDAVNWASLRALLPIGLYDLDKATGPALTLRIGTAGESFAGIRKDDVHLEGRLLVADGLGPCGSPTSDSARTSVDDGTRQALAIVFAPVDFPFPELRAAGQALADRVHAWCGGQCLLNTTHPTAT